jgi:hypothetical protein
MASPVDLSRDISLIGPDMRGNLPPSPRDPGRVSGGGHPAHGAEKVMSRDQKWLIDIQ